MHTLLIIDDDADFLEMMSIALERVGYHVLQAPNAQRALNLIKRERPDLFLIDAGLPDLDGVMLCQQIRKVSVFRRAPILFVTGRKTPQALVEALEAGGDDYIHKPFELKELIARIQAHLRRSVYYTAHDLPVLHLNPHTFGVSVGDRASTLTPVEFDLLSYLSDAPFRLHTTESLLMGVWGYPHGLGDAALVRNHVHNLRRKIEQDPMKPAVLQSRHGRGYLLRAIVSVVDLDEAHTG